MKRTFVALLTIPLLLAACKQVFPIPAFSTVTSTPTAASTPTASPAPTSTRTPIPPTVTPTPSSTPTPERTGPAIALVSTPTLCRAGPTNEYPLVAELDPGERLPVIGKAFAHWIVQPEGLPACWVDAALVAVSGDTARLPDLTIPPSSFKPNAPIHLKRVRGSCKPLYDIRAYQLEYLLTWTDNADNEDGFYVYRDANRIAELDANTTQLTDTFILHSGGHLFQYYVVVYNSVGRAQGESLWVRSLCR